MSMLQIFLEQFKALPVLVDSKTCSGKVYIVTGANIGLGLETARHLVRCNAARVILAVRNTEAGERAKDDIERTTNRKGVAEVWKLDLASFASVLAFADRVSTELERIDSLIENAGVMLDKWETSEDLETCMTVNVISTLLLGVLLMPKLMETARKYGIQPRLVILVSALGFVVKKELDKSGRSNMFDGFNDPKRADMYHRYSLTKLVQMFAIRELANLFPVSRTGVVINMIQPGLCSTGLARDTNTWMRIQLVTLRALLARTAEQGSRTILHGTIAGEESHGKLLSGCKVKDYWIPNWMINEDGQNIQKQIWKEVVGRIEKVQPDCISRIPSSPS